MTTQTANCQTTNLALLASANKGLRPVLSVKATPLTNVVRSFYVRGTLHATRANSEAMLAPSTSAVSEAAKVTNNSRFMLIVTTSFSSHKLHLLGASPQKVHYIFHLTAVNVVLCYREK